MNLLFGEGYFVHVCAVVFAVLLFVVVAKNVSAVKNTFPFSSFKWIHFAFQTTSNFAIFVAAGAAAAVTVTFNE